MAFQYDDGTATDVANWFTIFEAFMLTAGWTVEAGSGTQNITFKSIGEAGGRNKLYVRFRQDGVNPQDVWYRVQDDLAGTHFTTEDQFTENLDAGGGGVAAFDYWMAATRNYVTVCFLEGANYWGAYAGIVERFAVNVPDEEYEMVAYPLHRTAQAANGRVLRRDTGTWDQITRHRELTDSYERHTIDQSYCIFASYINMNVHNNIIGELIGVSGRMNLVAGLNPQDTIATGIGGATSWWTVLGTGTQRWAMFSGGTLPTGTWEGGFAHTSGTANTINLLQAALDAFLTGLGWTITPNGGGWAIDQYYRSTGVLGTEDIWLRWRYDDVQRYWGGGIIDPTLAHQLAWYAVGDNRLEPGDFPANYHFGGDKDCFYACVEVAGVWCWSWWGLFKPLWADNASYATEYNVGQIQGAAPTGPGPGLILRGPNGAWSQAISAWQDWFSLSSPQLMDGTSYMVWPEVRYHGAFVPVGIPKYIHRADGAALAVNDTITVGAKVYTQIGAGALGNMCWCIRTT